MQVTGTARPLSGMLLYLFCTGAMAAGPALHGLPLVYSTDPGICTSIAKALGEDRACRVEDAINCADDAETRSIRIGKLAFPVIDALATNEYGYTQVAKSISSSLSSTSIIYVSRFQGDRSPRLMETWKVDTEALNKVLSLPPGPLPYSRSQYLERQFDTDIHAKEFAGLLSKGEKIAGEWSPVLNLSGQSYALTRECSGEWVFGGNYACNRVIKLTVLQLHNEEKARPVCQFAGRNRK